MCGVRGVGSGVWGVGCGVWSVGCGVWDVGCGVWGVVKVVRFSERCLRCANATTQVKLDPRKHSQWSQSTPDLTYIHRSGVALCMSGQVWPYVCQVMCALDSTGHMPYVSTCPDLLYVLAICIMNPP